MLSTLNDVAGLLEGAEVLEAGSTVRGLCCGQSVILALKMRDHGSITVRWMEVRSQAPVGLLLALRLARSDAIDHVVNRLEYETVDPRVPRPFEETFDVEGAPERLVREILRDDEIRTALLSLGQMVLPEASAYSRGDWSLYPENLLSAEQGTFTLNAPGFREEHAALLVRTAATLAARGAEIVLRERTDQSGYRGEAPPERRMRDEEELRRAQDRIARKAAFKRWQPVVVWILMIVATVLFFALRHRGAPGP